MFDSGVYGCGTRLSVSHQTDWRWENVPRALSWPLSRTGIPLAAASRMPAPPRIGPIYVVTRLSREYAVGRLKVHRDGYGFLLSDRPLDHIAVDIFIPKDSASQAMHGDRVIVHISNT